MNKEDYLRTEIRDGYQVSVTRKKVWLCELEMATWFCNVCEKYGLNYFLIGGSAIGAVRHNGFIPWDDDLDIGMLRSDFDKFRKVSIRELPSNYKIEYGVLKTMYLVRYCEFAIMIRPELLLMNMSKMRLVVVFLLSYIHLIMFQLV